MLSITGHQMRTSLEQSLIIAICGFESQVNISSNPWIGAEDSLSDSKVTDYLHRWASECVSCGMCDEYVFIDELKRVARCVAMFSCAID